MSYAAKVIDGVVQQVIVGDASWANARLGGEWIASDELVGIGWLYDGAHFNPPPSPDPDI